MTADPQAETKDFSDPGYLRHCWHPRCTASYNAGRAYSGLESTDGWMMCPAIGAFGCPAHNAPWRDRSHVPAVRSHDCSCRWRMAAEPSTLGAFAAAYLAHLEAVLVVDGFNLAHVPGTPVTYWPATRDGNGRPGITSTPAFLVSGKPCVSVEGYPGGIALTHVEVREQADAG